MPTKQPSVKQRIEAQVVRMRVRSARLSREYELLRLSLALNAELLEQLALYSGHMPLSEAGFADAQAIVAKIDRLRAA